MSESKPRVILYYANWCNHCHSLYDAEQNKELEWNKLQKMLKKEGISYAEFEETKDSAVMEKENVDGYPTIRIDGKDYNGERTADAIIEYIKSDKKGGLDAKFKQCGGGRQYGFTPRIKGGGSSKTDAYYKVKYLKYKAKYMKLRSEIGV